MSATGVLLFEQARLSRVALARHVVVLNHPGGPGHDQKSHGRRGPKPFKLTPGGKIPRPRKQPRRMSPVDIASALESGIEAEEKITQGDNGETSLLRTKDGSLLIRKKVADTKYHTAQRQLDAEELTGQLALAIGAPAPAVFVDAEDDSVYMEFMAGTMAYRVDKKRQEAAVSSDAGRRIGLLDFVTQSWDRNGSNWLVDRDGNPVAIDHAFNFPSVAGRLRLDEDGHAKVFDGFNDTFKQQWKGKRKLPPDRWGIEGTERVWQPHYTAEEMSVMGRALRRLEPQFAAKGRQQWFDDAMAVFSGIAKESGVQV